MKINISAKCRFQETYQARFFFTLRMSNSRDNIVREERMQRFFKGKKNDLKYSRYQNNWKGKERKKRFESSEPF